MDKYFWLNLADRVGWTFFQALGGSVAAGATSATVGTFDWRAALAGAATAAALAALKVLGVNVGQAATAGGATRSADATRVDGVTPVVAAAGPAVGPLAVAGPVGSQATSGPAASPSA